MGRKKREYTYDNWKKAIDLHNHFKFGPTKISGILGISQYTLNNWLYYGRVPPMARWKAEPSNELGYAIGVLHRGDGCVSKDESRYQYKIRLATIDPEFAETFSRAMARILNRKYIEPYWSEKEKAWVVEYRSKAFYTWYKRCEEQGLEEFKPYIEHDRETVKHFLRGLYDSDGSNYKNELIILSNSNKRLLEYVQYLLKKYFDIVATGPYLQRKAGSTVIISGRKTRYNHDLYRIHIRKKSHVQAFLTEIGFAIIRKQLGLKKNGKMFVEGIGCVEPYELVKLGLFKLPFSDTR